MGGRFQAVRRWAGLVTAAVLLAGCGGQTAPEEGLLPPTQGKLTGQLLVAAPKLSDPTFSKTLVLIVRDDDQGAMGLVVNRTMARGPLASVLEEVGLDPGGAKGEIDIHFGGPVGVGSAFVVHSPDYVGNGTIAVAKGLAMSTTPQILKDLAEGTGPKRALFAIGYAGWAPGQLEAEIRRRDWVVLPADAELIFDSDFETKWRRAMARRGLEL